ncbi:MAG: ribosome small subunit-dependent GTPase A [Verrucomicrobiota bacterium JB023]|nr:ribosome small subunit-dependent GTPase A [Verrucomicrobiota bacterium JB023]
MTLQDLGWNEFFNEQFEPFRKKGWEPARLAEETKINFRALLDGEEELEVVTGGKVWHEATCDADLPAVGDWVAIERQGDDDEHIIRARLERRTTFSRKMPGKSSEEQVIAANVDLVIVVTDAVADFNVRRLERYLTLIARSGARPVILINKADLVNDDEMADLVAAVHEIEPQAEVRGASALKGTGLEILKSYLSPGVTMALVGSSGVGKSTLVNQLLGRDEVWTGDVNEVTGKGRHTTSWRELVMVPGGGMLIDNPGIREVQMWTDETTLREQFIDIEELTSQCRFSDCSHQKDAGCAIVAAVEKGELDPGRYESFLNLEDEIAELNRRRKKRQMAVERWAKRDRKIKARNLADRIQLEKDERGEL